MYIIDRLIILISTSDPDSSDYILASCFLDSRTFNNEKVTLAEIEKKTFISKSSINRFVRSCGASTLKSFCASLRREYQEDSVYMAVSRKNLKDTPKLSNECTEVLSAISKTLRHASKVYFYGRSAEISAFSGFMHTCVHHGIIPVILSDWPISQIRNKLYTADENDILLFSDCRYNLQMMQIGMALYEEVVPYTELAAFPGTKIFIGRHSAQGTDGFLTIPVPADADSYHYLIRIDRELIERSGNPV